MEGALKALEGALKGDKRKLVSAHLHGGLGALKAPSEAFKAPWMPFIRGLRAALNHKNFQAILVLRAAQSTTLKCCYESTTTRSFEITILSSVNLFLITVLIVNLVLFFVLISVAHRKRSRIAGLQVEVDLGSERSKTSCVPL